MIPFKRLSCWFRWISSLRKGGDIKVGSNSTYVPHHLLPPFKGKVGEEGCRTQSSNIKARPAEHSLSPIGGAIDRQTGEEKPSFMALFFSTLDRAPGLPPGFRGRKPKTQAAELPDG
jgi:hypothetical protein